MVAGVFSIYSRTYFCNLLPLGMADADTPFPDNIFGKSHGYNVTIHTC